MCWSLLLSLNSRQIEEGRDTHNIFTEYLFAIKSRSASSAISSLLIAWKSSDLKAALNLFGTCPSVQFHVHMCQPDVSSLYSRSPAQSTLPHSPRPKPAKPMLGSEIARPCFKRKTPRKCRKTRSTALWLVLGYQTTLCASSLCRWSICHKKL